MEELGKKTDVDNKFLFFVLCYACDYQIRKEKNPDEAAHYYSMYIETVVDAVHDANRDNYDYIGSMPPDSIYQILKRSNFFTPLIDDEPLLNSFFSIMFGAHVVNHYRTYLHDAPVNQRLFRYNILDGLSYPVSHYYFKQYMAGEDNPRKPIYWEQGGHKLVLSPAFILRPWDDHDTNEITTRLQKKYDAVPFYKDAKKSQKEVDAIIAKEIGDRKSDYKLSLIHI